MSNAGPDSASYAAKGAISHFTQGKLPQIIQGGMGIAVSNWTLANAVSRLGQLGVVSGTSMDGVLVRRLQDGDPGGHMRRALQNFPFKSFAQDLLEDFFIEGGKAADKPYKRLPLPTLSSRLFHKAVMVMGGFVEVFLAKEGHENPVGINLLTKIQLPTIPTLYGAMLAGADYVLMGAGIPREIPGILDQLALHQEASLKLEVEGAQKGDAPAMMRFDPKEFGTLPGPLKRPAFLPIIASNSLATMLLKRATGSIQGFIIEGPTAGGHNAPPRGPKTFDEKGQPVYGERDVVDLAHMRELGLPFWLAGGTGTPEGLQHALAEGAAGIQVGTLFAYTQEAGLEPHVRDAVLERVLEGKADIYTDAEASPTGFPFKVAGLPGTNSEKEMYEARTRVCDLGYLRGAYRKEDGSIGYRCASEPEADYVAKGGDIAETKGRKCLCNALMANIGLPQVQKSGEVERPLLTSGDDLVNLGGFLKRFSTKYTAKDAVNYLLGA